MPPDLPPLDTHEPGSNDSSTGSSSSDSGWSPTFSIDSSAKSWTSASSQPSTHSSTDWFLDSPTFSEVIFQRQQGEQEAIQHLQQQPTQTLEQQYWTWPLPSISDTLFDTLDQLKAESQLGLKILFLVILITVLAILSFVFTLLFFVFVVPYVSDFRPFADPHNPPHSNNPNIINPFNVTAPTAFEDLFLSLPARQVDLARHITSAPRHGETGAGENLGRVERLLNAVCDAAKDARIPESNPVFYGNTPNLSSACTKASSVLKNAETKWHAIDYDAHNVWVQDIERDLNSALVHFSYIQGVRLDVLGSKFIDLPDLQDGGWDFVNHVPSYPPHGLPETLPISVLWYLETWKNSSLNQADPYNSDRRVGHSSQWADACTMCTEGISDDLYDHFACQYQHGFPVRESFSTWHMIADSLPGQQLLAWAGDRHEDWDEWLELRRSAMNNEPAVFAAARYTAQAAVYIENLLYRTQVDLAIQRWTLPQEPVTGIFSEVLGRVFQGTRFGWDFHTEDEALTKRRKRLNTLDAAIEDLKHEYLTVIIPQVDLLATVALGFIDQCKDLSIARQLLDRHSSGFGWVNASASTVHNNDGTAWPVASLDENPSPKTGHTHVAPDYHVWWIGPPVHVNTPPVTMAVTYTTSPMSHPTSVVNTILKEADSMHQEARRFKCLYERRQKVGRGG